MNAQTNTHLIWIDLEMTGLNPETEVIIEIATLVTDAHLNVVAEGPNLAVHQPGHYLDNMDEWNTRQHNASGLVERVRASTVDTAAAEQQTLDFLRQYLAPDASPMCGNSIHQDRRFLWKYMPELERFFNYRHIDVSTLKELMRRWRPELDPLFKKTNQHRALNDIYDSIAELEFYRTHFLKDGLSTDTHR